MKTENRTGRNPLPMTPAELKTIRLGLGLSAEAFARLVRVESGRTVRRWEGGDGSVPGPVSLIAELLRDGALAPDRLRDAGREGSGDLADAD